MGSIAVAGSAIKKANCYHDHGRGASRCTSDEREQHLFMLLFGVAQLVLSFIPNFHSMAWLSVVAAVMSFTYSTIGLGLGLSKTIGIYSTLERNNSVNYLIFML